MRCNECGSEITEVITSVFNWDDSDTDTRFKLDDLGDATYGIAVGHNWTGDELDDEEAMECIRCPECGRFPFKKREMARYELVHLTFWD